MLELKINLNIHELKEIASSRKTFLFTILELIAKEIEDLLRNTQKITIPKVA